MADNDPKKIKVEEINIENQEKINRLLKDALGITLDWNDALGKSNKAGYDILSNLRQRARIEKDIKKNAKAYFDYLRESKELSEEIEAINKEILALEKEDTETNKETIEYLRKKTDELREQKNLIDTQLKKAKGLKTTFAGISDSVGKIKKGFKDFYFKFGLDDMSKMLKSIKTGGLEMGILSEQSDAFSMNLQKAKLQTIKFGVGLEDVVKLQTTFSDELGTTQLLTSQALEDFSAIGKATGIGSEGIGKMAAELQQAGMASKSISGYMDQVMNDSHDLGLNASKVIKNISQNIKLLNKYNFKNGAKGLAKMAEMTTKMGIDIQTVAPMAEKLFNIEGAVEMSAQLQVLGGQWSSLADPFKLMYMARNDMEGLTESVINATKATAKFNKKTGDFDISSLNMQVLRKVAEATGMDFEQLAQSAKNAAKYATIKKQISYGFDDKTKGFIESTAFLDEKGKAMIMIGGDPKYLDALTEEDKQKLKITANEKKTAKERAIVAQTFEDQFQNLVTMLKQLALPLIETLNNTLGPKLQGLINKLGDPKLLTWVKKLGENVIPKFVDTVWNFGKSIFHFIESIGKFIKEHPKISAAIGGGIIAGIAAFKGLKWFTYGQILGAGFNSVASVGRNGGNGMGGYMKNVGSRITPKSVGVGLAGMGVNMLTDATTTPGSGWNIAGKAAGSAMEWGSLGFMVGGPWGAAIGGILGGLYGGISAAMSSGEKELNQNNTVTANDAVVKFNPKDKFMKLNDSTMIAGTNENGNNNLAKAILASTSPIAGLGMAAYDYLSNKTTSGIAQGATPGTIKVEHDTINFGGSIELKINGETSNEIGKELLKNPGFIRDMSKMVHMATASAVSGKLPQNISSK